MKPDRRRETIVRESPAGGRSRAERPGAAAACEPEKHAARRAGDDPIDKVALREEEGRPEHGGDEVQLWRQGYTASPPEHRRIAIVRRALVLGCVVARLPADRHWDDGGARPV